MRFSMAITSARARLLATVTITSRHRGGKAWKLLVTPFEFADDVRTVEVLLLVTLNDSSVSFSQPVLIKPLVVMRLAVVVRFMASGAVRFAVILRIIF